MNCPHCGDEMQQGYALACSKKGGKMTSERIPLTPWCANLECQRKRDREAMDRAIARGLLAP